MNLIDEALSAWLEADEDVRLETLDRADRSVMEMIGKAFRAGWEAASTGVEEDDDGDGLEPWERYARTPLRLHQRLQSVETFVKEAYASLSKLDSRVYIVENARVAKRLELEKRLFLLEQVVEVFPEEEKKKEKEGA